MTHQAKAGGEEAGMHIRPFTSADWPEIWLMLEPVIRAGTTYALPRDMDEQSARAYWHGSDRQCFVAEANNSPVGTYYLRANQAGGHVANCAYVTAESARRQGVGRALCMHSIALAKTLGYRAIQFNFVISSNEPAVRLWQSLGFKIVGRLPEAFQHPSRGFVDAFVMFLPLD